MRARSILFYACITLTTVAVCEVLARAYDWRQAGLEATAADDLGPSRYGHSFSGAGDLVPKQDGHWVTWYHRPYHVQTNSTGVRNAEEAAAGGFRIYAIGDSQTFGPYLTNEDTWPAWTETTLRRRYGEPGRIQVFNAGIPGYSIIDELALLRDKGLAVKPNLVLLAVFENDLTDLRKGRPQRPDASESGSARLIVWPRGWVRHSALFGVVNDLKAQAQLRLAGVDVRRGEERTAAPAAPASPGSAKPSDLDALGSRYANLFKETAALLKSNAIPFAVFFIPSADTATDRSPSDMQPVLEKAARETATPYLDLTPLFRSERDAAERFYLLQRNAADAFVGNGHMSLEGNRTIGVALSAWLQTQKLVP